MEWVTSLRLGDGAKVAVGVAISSSSTTRTTRTTRWFAVADSMRTSAAYIMMDVQIDGKGPRRGGLMGAGSQKDGCSHADIGAWRVVVAPSSFAVWAIRGAANGDFGVGIVNLAVVVVAFINIVSEG